MQATFKNTILIYANKKYFKYTGNKNCKALTQELDRLRLRYDDVRAIEYLITTEWDTLGVNVETQDLEYFPEEFI
jgi:hypothetical protein